MYRPRVPKSQQGEKSLYTAYDPHTNSKNRNWEGEYLKVVSIDIGWKNFCIRVEKRPMKDPYKPITAELYERLSIMNKKGTENTLESAMLCPVYDVLTSYLDEHLELFKQCHYVIIERQLPVNYYAVRISQHTISYFLIKLKDTPLLPLILEIDSKLKTIQLDAPTGMNKREVKQWSEKKAEELLNKRKDAYSLSILKKSKKKDDLADTVCQIEALFNYFGYPLTLDTVKIKLQLPSSNEVDKDGQELRKFMNSQSHMDKTKNIKLKLSVCGTNKDASSITPKLMVLQ